MDTISSPPDLYAKWAVELPEGEIRRLLKYQVKYYFGGGLPGALPVKNLATIVKQIGEDILNDLNAGDMESGLKIFNYTKSAGTDSLRKVLLKQLVKRQNLPFDYEKDYHKLLVTAGAQQALYAILDSMINPGDVVLSAGPSYLGFVTPAVKLGAKVVLCPADGEGLIVEEVEKAIYATKASTGRAPKLLYVITDSDNPMGTTMPWERRKALFELCKRENVLIVEDAAYKEIRFNQQRIPPIKSLDSDNQQVLYVCSTSKEAGVLRLGYCVLPDNIRENVEKARGFYDLCSPVLTQLIAERYYSQSLDQLLMQELAVYRRRSKRMIEALSFYFPPGIFTRPSGGFFVWWDATENPDFDAKWFNEYVAIPNDVLYVPSVAFYPPVGYRVDEKGHLLPAYPKKNGMRLSFSAVPEELIVQGIQKLGQLLSEHLKK